MTEVKQKPNTISIKEATELSNFLQEREEILAFLLSKCSLQKETLEKNCDDMTAKALGNYMWRRESRLRTICTEIENSRNVLEKHIVSMEQVDQWAARTAGQTEKKESQKEGGTRWEDAGVQI